MRTRDVGRLGDAAAAVVHRPEFARLGVLAWDGAQFHAASAYRIEPLDTTGAGDIFHAGFIYGLLQGWPLQRQLDFACAAAALNCTAVGARGGIESTAKIEQLMAAGTRYAV